MFRRTAISVLLVVMSPPVAFAGQSSGTLHVGIVITGRNTSSTVNQKTGTSTTKATAVPPLDQLRKTQSGVIVINY